MRLFFKVKPRVIKGTSKFDVLSKANLGGWCVDKYGSRYVYMSRKIDNKHVHGINMEKHRKKVKVLKNGNRKVINKTYWVGYLYDFTKFADLIKIKQHKNNFKITLQ